MAETGDDLSGAAAGLKQGAVFRLPLAARILAGTPGLRWILPTIIGWGVRPARVKTVAEASRREAPR